MNDIPRSDALLSAGERAQLRPGDTVVVQREGEFSNVGEIDAMTEDGKALWVHLHNGRGRILLYEGDQAIVSRRVP